MAATLAARAPASSITAPFPRLFSARYGLHTLYLGLQKVSGDDGWMRVNGTSGGTLANDSTTPATTIPASAPGNCATTSTSLASAYPA